MTTLNLLPHTMRLAKLSFLVTFTLLIAPASRAQENAKAKLDLALCETLAMKNNPLIQDAMVDLSFSQAKFLQAENADILPTATARNIWGPSPQARGVFNEYGVLNSPDTSGISKLLFFTQVDIDLEQPLFTFGKYTGLASAASYQVRSAEAKVRQRQEEVRLQVRQLYWGLLLGKELLQVIEDAQSEIIKAENKLQEKLEQESEDVSQTDLFKLQMFKYEITKRRRDAIDRVELARTTLKLALGLNENDELEIASEFLDPVEIKLDSLPRYLKVAMTKRPELKKVRAERSAELARVDVASSQYYPQFFVASDISANYAKDRFDPNNPFRNSSTNFFRPRLMVGARMNLNYAQVRDKVRIAQAKSELTAQKERALAEKVRFEVEQKYLETVAKAATMKEGRRALRASNNWLRSTGMTYDVGVGEVSDFIDAYKANAAMKGENLQNIFEYNSAVARLSQAVGQDLLRQPAP